MVNVLPCLANQRESVWMTSEIYLALCFLGLGSLLVIIGLLHQTNALSHWDAQTFLRLHTQLRPYTGFFRYIWPLGTVPVGITLILIMFIASWQAGLSATLMYLLAAIIEWAIKRSKRLVSLTTRDISSPVCLSS